MLRERRNTFKAGRDHEFSSQCHAGMQTKKTQTESGTIRSF